MATRTSIISKEKKTHKLVSSNANYHSKVYGKEIKMEYATNKEELSYSNIYHFEKREYKKILYAEVKKNNEMQRILIAIHSVISKVFQIKSRATRSHINSVENFSIHNTNQDKHKKKYFKKRNEMMLHA